MNGTRLRALIVFFWIMRYGLCEWQTLLELAVCGGVLDFRS
jgi:hypothetical protein